MPAQLSGLAQLSKLSLASNSIQGGWEHLPRSLKQLHFQWSREEQVPAGAAPGATIWLGCDYFFDDYLDDEDDSDVSVPDLEAAFL